MGIRWFIDNTRPQTVFLTLLAAMFMFAILVNIEDKLVENANLYIHNSHLYLQKSFGVFHTFIHSLHSSWPPLPIRLIKPNPSINFT